jgi:hypothetical protein
MGSISWFSVWPKILIKCVKVGKTIVQSYYFLGTNVRGFFLANSPTCINLHLTWAQIMFKVSTLSFHLSFSQLVNIHVQLLITFKLVPLRPKTINVCLLLQRGYTVLALSVQDILLCNYLWQKSDIWSQASCRYAIIWEAFLDSSDSYFLFADFVGFYTHWTYIRGLSVLFVFL